MELTQFFKLRRQATKKLIKKSESIKADQFVVFEPLVSDLRKDSRVAMFSSFFILIRRLTLLYMAMFVHEMQWLQVMTFMAQNLISVCFLIIVMPYEDKKNNYLNIFNEVLSVLVSYFIIVVNEHSE